MSGFPAEKLRAIVRTECKKAPNVRRRPLVVEGMLDATTLGYNPDIYDDPHASRAYDDYKHLLLVKLASSSVVPQRKKTTRKKTTRKKTTRKKTRRKKLSTKKTQRTRSRA